MFESKIKDMVFSSLVADAYCLGSHWIYDEGQLKSLNINWNQLNNACSIWHKGRVSGECTHYGDQTYNFYKFIENKTDFNVNEYIQNWHEQMKIYNGYIDGSTRETIKNLEEGLSVPCGAVSHDLSVVSRIVPLLAVSASKEEFLSNVQEFVKSTHNEASVLESAKFFAHLLLDVLDGKDIVSSIENLKEKYSSTIQNWINQGLASKNAVTFDSIREFGPACSVDGGFASVIHLLVKYSDFKEVMINNAQAGGDNSARAMMVAPLLIARHGANKIPQEWMKIKHTL